MAERVLLPGLSTIYPHVSAGVSYISIIYRLLKGIGMAGEPGKAAPGSC